MIILLSPTAYSPMLDPVLLVDGLLLGLVQGITEWLPVSSEGAVTAVGSFALGMEVDEALAVAVWLHLGTSIAALFAYRSEVRGIVGEALGDPRHPSPLLGFLLIATLTSGVIGLPLLALVGEASASFGAGAMVAVGGLMLVTGVALARRPAVGLRGRDDVTALDAVLAGVAQGVAALPGLSRSGLTVAVLLGRSVDRTEALALSFLMSIPAGMGAALFAGIEAGLLTSLSGIVGLLTAAVVGFASIRALVSLAQRVNFALFVLIAGLAVIAGGAWQMTL